MFCDIARQSVSQPWVFPYITGMYEHISRSGNIATLNLLRIKYVGGDSFVTSFGDSKTKKCGEENKIERAFFHNPGAPESNFTVAVALHVFCNDRQPATAGDHAVFGSAGVANKNFEDWLSQVKLDLNDSQRLVLGSAVEDIGIHGFRKSAFTFASNAVDGAPQPAIELRGNHSQGTIKDM